MKSKRLQVLSFFLLLLLAACGKDTPALAPGKQRGDFIDAGPEGRLAKEKVVEFVSEVPLAGLAQYDVKYRYITYRTEFDGKAIDTRGMLLVPDGLDTAYLVAYLHGTHVPLKAAGAEKQTPSNYKGESDNFLELRSIGLSLATSGYTVFLPDYIGYGITEDKEHPYVYYPELFKQNIDGLLAAKDYLNDNGYYYDNRLFITGWSQGAGACLSAHKYVQEQYPSEFTVVASSGLSGPYNFRAFLQDLFDKKDQEVKYVSIYSWGVYTVNKFSGIKRPTDQLWSYPVYDQFSALITPSLRPDKIFNNYFMERILNGSDTQMLGAIAGNSYHEGWTPVGKVFLHHGDADEIVPYFNSVDAKTGLTAAGGDVTLYTYPGGTHDSELDKYVLKTIDDFNTLK
ncbi:MAG: alpha/beta hydrolase family protein [Flavobacteriales bacterium]